jgi:hypothetical protein
VAAREELVVRHEVGGDEHRVVRGCVHLSCGGEGFVVSGLGRGGRLGENGRRGVGSVWRLGVCL